MGFPRTVAVAGLGLMGGSIVRDLAARGTRILVHDQADDVLRDVTDAGLAAGILDRDLTGLAAADLLVIATPVDAALDLLTRAVPHLREGAWVTDVGSTKRAICDLAVRLGVGDRFVGSHPLTGDDRSGWSASRAGMYAGARVFLCPTPSTSDRTLERATAFWAALGATSERMDPARHDLRIAWISHLPQLASSALANVLREHEIAASELGPGGRDATRLAGSSPGMWSAISLQNRDHLLPAIEALEARLSSLRDTLRRGDREALERFFDTAREWRHQHSEDPR